MGLLLLFVFVLLEILLTFYRVKTQTIQNKFTSIFRIAEFFVIITLVVISVIHWGGRYYGLVAILAFQATAGLAYLIGRKKSKKQYSHALTLRRAVGMAAVLFLSSLPAILFPQYENMPTTGMYAVQNTVFHYSDQSRTESYGNQGGPRTLTVEFWYPDQNGASYPLIVFSHGSFGIRGSNETLYREMASHGYVICSIDHTYQCLYTNAENRKTIWMDSGYANEIRIENAKEDPAKSLALYKKWMDVRVGDISFVIDTILLQTKKASADGVYSLVNPEKIGVIGHSLGGSAALGIGRLRSDIGAVIALEAPFLCDIKAVEKDSFVFDNSEYPVPVLNIYSDSSWEHLDTWPQYATNARLLSGKDKDAYTLHISGAGHLSLTDLSLSSPMLTRVLNGHKTSISAEKCLGTINQACLSFFDCFLKGMEEDWKNLRL